MLNVQIRPEQSIPAYATVDWYELFDAAVELLGDHAADITVTH